MLFLFDRFELDPVRRRLTCSGEPLAISDRQLDVLLLLVARAGQIVSKDDLLQAGWKDVAVGDNSLEQAISSLRRALGGSFIDTVARRGYRFGAPVARGTQRQSDAALDALLAPHRAFVEGRAALETLQREEITRAREVFETALRTVPEHASAHVGLANACILQFEMTRTDPAPDAAALAVAAEHAREACRLDPHLGEAWATLGFVLDRTGRRVDAIAASRLAVTLEPDNWRHHIRLSYVSWGEERLRAAQRTLTLLPAFPLAHWLAATVYVARQALVEAERQLQLGLQAFSGSGGGDTRFSAVALYWLLGLIRLAQGDEARALDAFELELSSQPPAHLYARECGANTWYAIGAVRLRQQRHDEARAAFEHAIEKVPAHPPARVVSAALAAAEQDAIDPQGKTLSDDKTDPGRSFDIAFLQAIKHVLVGNHHHAGRMVDEALSSAPAGNAGWLLPIEPLLNVTAHLDAWSGALALLRRRAV